MDSVWQNISARLFGDNGDCLPGTDQLRGIDGASRHGPVKANHSGHVKTKEEHPQKANWPPAFLLPLIGNRREPFPAHRDASAQHSYKQDCAGAQTAMLSAHARSVQIPEMLVIMSNHVELIGEGKDSWQELPKDGDTSAAGGTRFLWRNGFFHSWPVRLIC